MRGHCADNLWGQRALIFEAPEPAVAAASATMGRRNVEMDRRFALVLAIAAVSFGNSTLAEELSGTLKKIKDGGAITLGHRADALPFSYQDDKGNVYGYSVELCNHIVDAVKSDLKLPQLKIDWVEVTAANRFRLVKNGTVDLECGTTTNTLGREQEAAFSVTTFVVGNRFVSKKRMGIQEFADLKGLTVASLSGTTNIRQVVDLNSDQGLEMVILPASSPAEAMRLLETNQISAFFWDGVLLAGAVAAVENPRQYVISKQALSVEPYAIMMRKDDPRFKQAVDDALVSLFRSDEIKNVFDRWFASPIPPSGINLQLPMTPALQRVFSNPTDSPDPAAYEAS
jgi:glutamate/aspartate transport system substrate-binding protein